MKKKIFGLAAALLLTVGLAACGNNSDSKDSANKADDTTLKVGASPTPHAEILEHVKPLLKDEGIDLEIVKFDDYVLPNQSLEEGDIDANYFQHIPYLNKEIKEKDMTLSMPVLSTSNQWACTLKKSKMFRIKRWCNNHYFKF